ncbi:MAG TPA: SDR family NAD(P)-dependent oxidoreductase, partial [Candidatus Acidoferrales bacterium]|nr:SDR family NAD(P)-dependent oxidoreductase [Candidatus Acidoferrales bacterium]
DVSQRGEVEALKEDAVRAFGRIDVWINNAGVATYGEFSDSPMEEHEQVIRTNLLGTMYGSDAALQQFREQKQGVLIDVASFAGIAAFPFGASYTASKHGIRGLDVALRQELEVSGHKNIRVCTISPTSMDTPFFEHAANHTGRPVRPMPPVYDPKLVIQAIYKAALKAKAEIVVGRRGKIGKIVKRMAPRLMEKQMARRAHKAMMQQRERASDSPGNLFSPSASGEGVRGGWRRSLLKQSAGTAAVVVPLAAAALIWIRSKQNISGLRGERAA